MALTTLGPALDLHVGGADLRYPHHAYESAMAEAVTGVAPFARAWLHVGTVGLDGAKMAKSTGNLVLVSDVLAKHPAAALRLLLVDRPWAQEWEYDPAALDAAAARLERLYGAAARGALDTGTAAAPRSPPPCSTTSTCPAPSPSPKRRAARRRGSRCRSSGSADPGRASGRATAAGRLRAGGPLGLRPRGLDERHPRRRARAGDADQRGGARVPRPWTCARTPAWRVISSTSRR